MHKWAMFGVFCLAGIFSIYLILFTLPSKEEAEREAAFEVPVREIDAGAAEQLLTQQNCIGCHGGNLEGGMGPALDKVGSTLTKEQIYRVIMNGGNGMPGFEDQLTEDEIINLSLFLAEKQ
ncbi:c-type cytochrome [Paenibacillus sp. 1P07SE]|uniref:c-type cytochrome n=1 Tax=Paenibacillus sp. 1P07SE TaxID=3132209 RepID=UPI0039A777C8